MTGMEAIIVAAIAAVGGIITALVQKMRVENRDDHDRVASLLCSVKDELLDLHHKIDHVDKQVDKVDDQMHDHMMWHYRKSDESKENKQEREKKNGNDEQKENE